MPTRHLAFICSFFNAFFMKNKFVITVFFSLCAAAIFAQNITFQNQNFEAKNVHAAVVQLNGEQVLKVERDLAAIPFDVKKLESTVDEPTYVKLQNVNFGDGTIEVKMLARIQNPSPFEFAQGFIGLAFRIDERDKAFEAIYLRPKVGRSDNQKFRNKTVQYFAYPDFKFERLRREFPETYETAAPVGIEEWITFRIEVRGERAELFVNNARHSTMVVPKMLGKTRSGGIGLWVDIGTEGYFKDLKITPAQAANETATPPKPASVAVNFSDKNERAIVELLEKESATWRAGDVAGHAECWQARPYSRVLISTGDGTSLDVPVSFLINPPANMIGGGGYAELSNFKFSISKKTAWVSHDEVSVAPDGTRTNSREFRMLEKVRGQWKLVGQSIHVGGK
jgi:hypothetical protein